MCWLLITTRCIRRIHPFPSPGTPGYMCPEYMETRVFDVKSEVFAFGVVLAELFTGVLQENSVDAAGRRLPLRKAVANLPPDPRAGALDPLCEAALRELVTDCMRAYETRIPHMLDVIRRLRQLLEGVWPSMDVTRLTRIVEENSLLRQELGALRSERKGSHRNYLKQGNIEVDLGSDEGEGAEGGSEERFFFSAGDVRRRTVVVRECQICRTEEDVERGVECGFRSRSSSTASATSAMAVPMAPMSPISAFPLSSSSSSLSLMSSVDDQHFICDGCFAGDMLTHQLSAFARSDFIAHQSRLVCPLCLPTVVPYSDRIVALHLTEEAFVRYRMAATEVAEVQAFTRAQHRFQQQVAEIKAALQQRRHSASAAVKGEGEVEEDGNGDDHEAEQLRQEQQKRRVLLHRLHIAEEILTLHCPSKACNMAIVDFEGCFAVECTYGCKRFFCGWCLSIVGSSRRVHQHVTSCRMNPRPGPDAVFNSLNEFNRIHKTRRARRVRRYLDREVGAER